MFRSDRADGKRRVIEGETEWESESDTETDAGQTEVAIVVDKQDMGMLWQQRCQATQSINYKWGPNSLSFQSCNENWHRTALAKL